MSQPAQPISSLNVLDAKFRGTFLDVCRKGYSVLGHTLSADDINEKNPWQFGSGYPPSYFAQGRYRFLKTIDIAQRLNPKNILEVAAGGGFNGACLYKPGRRVVINDLRISQDDVKHWSTGKNLTIVPGNLFNLDPDSLGRFDLVMACEVIEHVAHGDQLINHLKQFLTPGGTLLITTPNGSYFRSKLPTYSQIKDFTALEDKQFQPDADGHLYLYTSQEILNLLETTGFKDIKIDLSITPFLSGHIGLRFLLSSPLLSKVYYGLDNFLKNSKMNIRARLCTQMIICAMVD